MFEDARLDDEDALAQADASLRELAESGARVRTDAGTVAEAVAGSWRAIDAPRALVAIGPASRLLRAVLEPVCPVPFVAWDQPGLPGWTGRLDLVVVLGAPSGPSVEATTAEAVRRGCPLLLVTTPTSPLAEVGQSRWTSLLPTTTGDPFAAAVVALGALHGAGLGPSVDADEVAHALDEVAISCSPYADLGTNPAKTVASSLGDATPLCWGGSVLAARASRRWAESLRRSVGVPALAAAADDVVSLVEQTPPRDLFADPFDDPPPPAPSVVILDDGSQAPAVRVDRGRVLAAAERRGVRIDRVEAGTGSDLARYARLIATGGYVATYLAVGRDAGPGR